MLWTWLIFPPRSHPSPHWQQWGSAVVSLCAAARRRQLGRNWSHWAEYSFQHQIFTSHRCIKVLPDPLKLIRSHSICVGGTCEAAWRDICRETCQTTKTGFFLKGREICLWPLLQHTTIKSGNGTCFPDDDVLKTPSSKLGGGCCCKILGPGS